MKPTRDALLERFRQAYPKAVIQLENESHLHVGHAAAPRVALAISECG
ncbi:MAG: hypothetical protein ACI8W7_004414 [Gammaproteobacteria bacterium]|jgi:stress-induced morphogen